MFMWGVNFYGLHICLPNERSSVCHELISIWVFVQFNSSAHERSSSWMTSLCFQQWEQLKCSSISSQNTSITMKSIPHNINQMKHKPRTFLLSKSIYSSTKITDSEIKSVIALTFYTQCKKIAVFYDLFTKCTCKMSINH